VFESPPTCFARRMADPAQRQRLRQLVGELHSRVEVRDPDRATEILTANITARNLANVSALTNKRKLSERASDPRRVDAIYTGLKATGHQPVTDRFVNVLLKLHEAPELLSMIADPGVEGLAPRDQPSTAASAAAGGGAPPASSASEDPRGLLRARLPGPPSTTSITAAPASSIAPPTSADSRTAAAATRSQHASEGAIRSGLRGSGAPVLPARTLGLPNKNGTLIPTLPDWTRDRPFLTGDFARLAVDSSLLPLPDPSQRPAPMPISSFPHAVQEVMVVEELLSALTGIEGKYIRASTTKLDRLSFTIDPAIDPSLADLCGRILPLACNAHAVSRYINVHCRFEYGRICHAFCAALRHVMKEFYVLVCQLEHQFVKEQLSLQKLWFYVQPTLRVFGVLDRLISVLTRSHSVGGALLNVVYAQATAIGGDEETHAVLHFLLQEASAPFFEILGHWIHAGHVDDPYDEFFIDEQELQRRHDQMEVYDDSYWQRKFIMREEMLPLFLAHLRDQIFNAGKFLHVIRACELSERLDQTSDKREILQYTPQPREYTAPIERAYTFASRVLLDHIMVDLQLKARLVSLKRFFLLDQGDFLVHFMDVAEGELIKNVSQISLPKLRSLLDSALRSSTASQDPYCDDLTCQLLPYTLISQLLRVISVKHDRPGEETSLPAASLTHQGQVTGVEAFTFDYSVNWPLSLVLSKYAITKYQLLFRHLFHCKHLERLLSATWQTHQTTKALDVARGRAFSLSFQLRQRMLHFLHNFLYYMMFEVIEPNWHTLTERLKTVKTIDEVWCCGIARQTVKK
jgi:gamma-tubulin complex component 2